MDRSPGFGSIIYDFIRPFQTRFLFGSIPFLVFNLAIYNNSLDRSTKSTISHLNVLYLLVNIGFQVLFHSPPGVLFTFPSRYWFTIGHQGVFSLGGWSLQLPTGFHVSRSTQDTSFYRRLSYTGLLPSMVQLSNCILLTYCQIMKSYNPRSENLVWALPASLAATRGIEFSFSSSGY